LLGKQCIVVMPDNSAAVKVEAVKEFGGIVELVATREKSRKQRLSELSEIHPDAFVASAYDHPLIIQGNATLGHELSRAPIDLVISPVGGGGLISGIITGLREKNSNAIVFGAEPAMANDAAQSLREGKIVAWDQEQQTIADGARTLSLGQHNWEVIKTGVKDIIEVPEEKIAEALKLLLWLANLKVEPTGALALGAVLTAPERFQNKRVCCVVSGGNVDPEIFIRLLNM